MVRCTFLQQYLDKGVPFHNKFNAVVFTALHEKP